jgi:ABC transport system ATP-binding/permease protein
LSPNGGEYIDVMGKVRHVCGYLKDFLFDPAMARQPVSTLSGGMKNRLMLARVLANPGSFLILDEPTNDLDMETLDMLEEILSQYKGTLIVVSHDRDFLDQTVTKILAFEGEGKIEGYIGGYTDYLEAKNAERKLLDPAAKKLENTRGSPQRAEPKPQKKLSYKLQFELDRLPGMIEALKKEIQQLETELEDPTLYQRDAAYFHTLTQRLSTKREELDAAESRWIELADMTPMPS